MKILVTGADGYIGSLLAPMLSDRGHDVVGLDAGFYRDGWLYNGVERSPTCISKDIRHIIAEDLKGFDAVVHLAELSNDPLGELNPEITFKINHLGSLGLARSCKEVGVTRFIYSSSCSVYGAGSDDLRTEESETDPLTAYAKCKVLVERDVSALADDNFSPTFLRNATAYGPSPRMRFDLVLNNLAGLAWTTKQIKMTSDGAPWRPLVHVIDICRAMAFALEAPREFVHNQIFNVGDTAENHQVRKIAQIVAASFPGCELVFGESGGDNRSYRVSFDKIHSRLPGFRCRYDAKAGADQLRELFELVDLTPDTFEHPAFTRLMKLQHLIETEQLDRDLFFRTPLQHTLGAV